MSEPSYKTKQHIVIKVEVPRGASAAKHKNLIKGRVADALAKLPTDVLAMSHGLLLDVSNQTKNPPGGAGS